MRKLNDFEKQLVEILKDWMECNEFDSVKEVTPDFCKSTIEFYNDSFSFLDPDILYGSLKHSDLPTRLIIAACKVAWENIDWELIALECASLRSEHYLSNYNFG